MAGLGDYGLRLGGVDSAGVDVTDPTRLSQHLSENRHGRRPCCGGVVDLPRAANAGADKIHRWKRIGFRRHFRSEEHTSELQSQSNIVCRLLLVKKKNKTIKVTTHISHN